MSFLLGLIPFIILLGAVIFVHELGHFLLAKFFRVGVEKFSLGFGKKVIGKKVGETEYLISALPLGGYVKMIGEDPTVEVSPQDIEKSFAHKPIYQRFLIVLAGPLGNLIFGFFIYIILSLIGIPHTATNHVGYVKKDSPAWKAGLRPGDLVNSINGKETKWWEDIEKYIRNSKGEEILLKVKRENEEFETKVKPEEKTILNELGIGSKEWDIGIDSSGFIPVVGVEDINSPAYKAGIKTGDLITKVNGKEVKFLYELEKIIKANPGNELELEVKRAKEGDNKREEDETLKIKVTPILTERINENNEIEKVGDIGIQNLELFIMGVKKGMPADQAGLKVGDKIKKIEGFPVLEYEDFKNIIRSNPDKILNLEISRNGEILEKKIQPIVDTISSHSGIKEKVPIIGISFYNVRNAEITGDRRYTNPLDILSKSLALTYHYLDLNIKTFGMLIIGRVSLDTLGGPIAIAKASVDSYKKGVKYYLFIMAFISVGLCIINLIPIPILDGGHLLFFCIEKVLKKPLSLKTREVAFKIGFIFLISLMLFVIFNDIRRFFF